MAATTIGASASGRIDCLGLLPTFAKQVFTNAYRQRPNTSFLIRIAKSRLPRMKAPV